MKLPSWLKVVRTERQGNSLIMVMRVRKWHPYFWYLMLRTYVRWLFNVQ